ncbi:MAG: sodium:alanine symporter family protein, partial [Clostridia bacterium]|nr:sodium:alanine symporter family protein [Clostridia bacterium]
ISVIKGVLGRIPSHLYTLLIILLSLTMGTALQASAVREAAVGVGIPYLAKLLPIPLTALTAAICIFGKRGIKNAVALMIPAASIVYTLLCLSVIIPNARSIPSVTLDILTSAFSARASLGGISGFIFASGMREGFSVGLLSNEAGAGTSSLSHTSGECGNAFRGGVFGILEVFFDTAVLCTLTAFTILLGFPQYAQGVDITVLSGIFDDYCGRIGSQALLASVLLFAVSTTLCWYYYGRLSAERLFGKRALPIFGALFLISFAAGLIFDIPRLVPLTDTVLFLLTVISVSALIKSSDRICALSEEYLNISSRKPFRVIKASKGGSKEPSCDSSKGCPDAIR